MFGLIDLICSAIARQEGWWLPNSIPAKRKNPGDLRAAPWLQHPLIVDGYWEADSPAQGIAGLYHQVALEIARHATLRALINKWAPAADHNDPNGYLANVMLWTGIADPDAPLQNWLELKPPAQWS